MPLARLVFVGGSPQIVEERPAELRRLRRNVNRQGWSTLSVYHDGRVLHGLYVSATKTVMVYTPDLQPVTEVRTPGFSLNRRAA